MKLKPYILLSKDTFKLAYPVMLSQLGQVLVGVADSIMVGRIGKESLAGASLGNSIFVLFLTFGIGISFGITPLIAKSDGENDTGSIIEILKHGYLAGFILDLGATGIWIGLLIGLTITAIMLIRRFNYISLIQNQKINISSG